MIKGMVYVAGPMTLGPREENIRNAFEAGEMLFNLGWAPFMPQLSFYFDDHFGHSWEEWLEYDFFIISRCVALLRLPGESRGADREVEYAGQIRVPVFYSIEELQQWRT